MSRTTISASLLYSLVACPHRVTMDLYEDPAHRDRVNPFVELLWERGSAFERRTVDALDIPFENLQPITEAAKVRQTRAAMSAGAMLIYGGRIEADDLVGEPDLLRKEGSGYIPGDIKSGAGKEGGGEEDEKKPKKTYAVQLALYVDVLERLGLSAARRGFSEARERFCVLKTNILSSRADSEAAGGTVIEAEGYDKAIEISVRHHETIELSIGC